MKRTLSFLLALSVMLMVLASCTAPEPETASQDGQQTDESQSESAPEETPQEQTVITMSWTNLQEEKQQVWNENIFNVFTEKYPNVTIEANFIPDHEQTLRVQLAAGAAADMFSMDATDVFEYASSGFIKNLESYREQYMLDDSMYEWALSACQYDGSLYALPHSVESSDMTYNKTLLDQLGVPVPTTREEFVAACEAAQANDLIAIAYGYSGIPVLVAWMYGHYLTTYAGPENVEMLLKGEITFQDPNIRGAFELMKADWDAGYINEKQSGAISIDEARSLFINQKAVFNFEGSWLTMADMTPGSWEFEWGQTGWPSMREGVSAAGDISVGECIGFNSESDNTDLCIEMMSEFYLDENRAAEAVAQGFSTPALDLNDELYPEDMHQDIKDALQYQEEIMNAPSVGYAPWGFYPPTMKVFLDDNLDKILYDQMTMDEFLDSAQALLEEDLANGYVFAG